MPTEIRNAPPSTAAAGGPVDPTDASAVRSMFDRIAPTYDLLNRLISLGLDRRWRRRAVGVLRDGERSGPWLDLAAGSGDVALEVAQAGDGFVVGVDFSVNMLALMAGKAEKAGVSGRVAAAAGDALALPFSDETFGGVIVAFGIRNFRDRAASLAEMRRVLKPGGVAVILELTRPAGAISRACYDLHARIVVPAAGRLISGDGSAYSYLPESIAAFPAAADFLSLMSAAGFTDERSERLAMGAATIFSGTRPARS